MNHTQNASTLTPAWSEPAMLRIIERYFARPWWTRALDTLVLNMAVRLPLCWNHALTGAAWLGMWPHQRWRQLRREAR